MSLLDPLVEFLSLLRIRILFLILNLILILSFLDFLVKLLSLNLILILSFLDSNDLRFI
jgi:hypothetical protein